jgi:hypothetical protein
VAVLQLDAAQLETDDRAAESGVSVFDDEVEVGVDLRWRRAWSGAPAVISQDVPLVAAVRFSHEVER